MDTNSRKGTEGTCILLDYSLGYAHVNHFSNFRMESLNLNQMCGANLGQILGAQRTYVAMNLTLVTPKTIAEFSFSLPIPSSRTSFKTQYFCLNIKFRKVIA